MTPRESRACAVYKIEVMNFKIGYVALVGAVILLASCSSSPEILGENSASGPASTASSGSSDSAAAAWPYEEGELLSGTATPNLPEGESGNVSVVEIGAFDGSRLPFAYRNNTDEAISHVDWSGTARSGGSVVATGSSQGGTPSQVPPGGVGLAYIYFGLDTDLPAEAKYEFSESHMPADTSHYNTAPFVITETNDVGGSIVGAAVNRTGSTVTGPYGVDVYCFDGDDLVSSTGDFAEQSGALEDGETVTFTVDLYSEPCPTYLLGVSGFFNPS